MRLGLVVNDIQTERPGYTTTHLAMAATHLGHEAWYINVADLAYGPNESAHAWGRRVSKSSHRLCHNYLEDLQGPHAVREYLSLSDLDVLMLRNNPADDIDSRPWARLAGINFGRFAARQGVLVINDPDGLSRAVNKLYLQQFPAEVRPQVLVSRDRDHIKAFAKTMGGTVVLKPLHGSGGRNVFLVRPDDMPNINQMIEAVSRDGYVIAQEYLPEAVHGDTRLFLLNGRPFCHHGHYAALRRVREDGDMRSNMTAGAKAAPAAITDENLALAEALRPQLLLDGMFLVGLDIVGNKLMEINVFSPGGLESAERFTDTRFSQLLIHDLERKLDHRRQGDRYFTNRELAVL